MGCICGKQLVKSSVERLSANQREATDEEPSLNSLKLCEAIPSETLSISLQQKNLESKLPMKKKEKTNLCPQALAESFSFYNFSKESASEIERSHSSDWQQLIQIHFSAFEASLKPLNTRNEAINTDWDLNTRIELTKKVLNLPPRNWINEQIYLMNQTLQRPSDTGANFNRKSIQLKYQFQWLVWAIGNYFYVHIGGKSRKVNEDFEEFTGMHFELPEKKTEWLGGFYFKSVKFQLLHQASPEYKAFKSEVKAVKLLYLENQNTTYGLVFPLLTYIKIGIFIITAMPVYSPTFLGNSENLYFDLFSKTNFAIPSTSLFKLKVESEVFLVYNAVDFVPELKKLSYVCVFSVDNDAIQIFDNKAERRVSKKRVIRYLYGKKLKHVELGKANFAVNGWDCFVFWDLNGKSQQKHEFSNNFGGVIGDFVVYFYLEKKQYRRYPLISFEPHENSQNLRNNIKECVNALECSEAISNQLALTELLHRKGLNSYHKWIIYSKCRSERTKTLLESALLAKGIKSLIASNMYTKSQSKLKSLKKQLCKVLKALLMPQSCGPESTPNLGFILFLQRLKCLKDSFAFKANLDQSASRIISPLGDKMHSQEFLNSSEMIKKVLSVGCRHPKELLQAIEHIFAVIFDPSFISRAANDVYSFLEAAEVVSVKSISHLDLEVFSITSLREESFLLYLSMRDRSYYEENSIEDSQIYLLPKEHEFCSLDMVIPGDLYSLSHKMFKPNYSLPSLSLLQEWAHVHESLYKDLITPTGHESVIIEVYLMMCSLLISKEKNSEACIGLLNKISKTIENSIKIPADLVIGYYMWNGICQEYHSISIAEQSYIAALLIMIKIYGDPRGRNNSGIPWQMFASWKLSKIAREEKRLIDAQISEEIFDSVFMNNNESQKKFERKYSKQQRTIYKNPFEKSNDPQWDELMPWVSNSSVVLYQNCMFWTRAELLEYTRTSQLHMYSQVINTSGTSTPTSHKDTRRSMQNSVSQALMLQGYVLHAENMVGTVYVWGSDTDGQLGIFNGRDNTKVLMYPRMLTALKNLVITEIAVGALHCIAITVDGLCYAWGNNEGFQLGLGPDMPVNITQPMLIKATNNIKKAACGYQHSLLLNSEGNVLSMGIGDGGVLGHNNTNSIMYPKVILSLKKFYIAKIEAGGYHNLALTNEGHVYVWGRGDGGQLGLDHTELLYNNGEIYVDYPIRIFNSLSQKRIMQVACGEAHCLALTDEGKVFAWGWGSNGQLGNGYREEDFVESGNMLSIQYTPTLILSFTQTITQISAGGLFSMFLTEDNEVFICGANDKKQLGLECEARDVAIPTQIECFLGYSVQNIVCGESHCVAVVEKMLWTWGNYREHQLGLGEITGISMPRPVQSLTNAVIGKVACGRTHSAVVLGLPLKSLKKPHKSCEINWKIQQV